MEIDAVTTALVRALQSDVFIGLAFFSVFGSLLVVCRKLPAALGRACLRLFTVEVSIPSHNATYFWVMEWLAINRLTKKSRRLQLSTQVRPYSNDDGWAFQPGSGWHWFRYRGRWVFLHKEIKESKALEPPQVVTLKTFGRGREFLSLLFSEAEASYFRKDKVKVYLWNGFWQFASTRNSRSPESLFLSSEVKSRVLDDVGCFLDGAGWYAEMGVPYRRAYLFHGQPGTGKTSLVHVLASVYQLPIFSLDLNTAGGPRGLQTAFALAEKPCIILIEDIDAFGVAQRRDSAEAAPAGNTTVISSDGVEPDLTLSSLLNVIDGVASAEGYILVMTSNDPTRLDPALTRGGRVDVSIHIGPPGHQERIDMYRHFRPDEEGSLSAERFARMTEGESTATIQTRLLNGEVLEDPETGPSPSTEPVHRLSGSQ